MILLLAPKPILLVVAFNKLPQPPLKAQKGPDKEAVIYPPDSWKLSFSPSEICSALVAISSVFKPS
jgi:hypothetical protein